MRVSATTTSLSWIPSESVWGPLKLGFDLGLSHWDEPMPDRISGVDEVQALHDTGRFRFANILQAWVDIEDGRIVGAILLGYSQEVAAVRTAIARGFHVAGVMASLRAGRWETLAELSGERPLLAGAPTGAA